MRVPFTDLAVRAFSPGVHFDARTPGFGIRVGKLKNTWIVVRTKARLQTVVGHYPELSLADARKEAKRLLTEEPTKKVTTITFKEARDRYLREHTGRPSTKRELTRILTNRFDTFDTSAVTAITDKAVEKIITPLPPSEALHSFRAIRAMLRWCVRPPRRFLPHSPIEGFAPPGRDGKRTRVLSDTEISRVLEASSGFTGGIVRLMLLWGTRKGETVALRRSWIADSVLTIPAEITKSARPHTIPILPLAQSVLDALPNDCDHFFAGERKRTGPINTATWTRLHNKLLTASKTEGWSAHDCRRTFRSACARLRIPRDLAERLLNHTQGPLDEIYDHHDYIDEKREALAKIESWIGKLQTSSVTPPGH